MPAGNYYDALSSDQNNHRESKSASDQKNQTNMSKLLRLQVQFWGGWGYEKYYRSLRSFLEAQPFGKDLQFVPLKDTRITGNFDVTILETGELIHSKKKQGKGRAESARERAIIVERIQDTLSSMA